MLTTSNGLFLHFWRFNKKAEKVYPYLMNKNETVGFNITPTTDKKDYAIVTFDQFITNLANGNYAEIGRIKMKTEHGGQVNGFAIRDGLMSQELIDELNRIRKK